MAEPKDPKDMATSLKSNSAPLAGLEFDPSACGVLGKVREEAYQAFLDRGVPTTKDEEYKYTPVTDLADRYFVQGGPVPVPESAITDWIYGDLDQIRIVFVNGHFSEELTTSLRGVEGLEIRTLSCALGGRQEIIEDLFGKLVKPQQFPFAGLNTGTFKEGTYIRISANTKIEKPIHILNIATADANGATQYVAPRALVFVEAGADATLIETFATYGDGPTFSNAVTEIHIEPNGHLQLVKVQQEGLKSHHIANTEVHQAPDSAFNHYSVTFGGKLTRNDLNVFLDGQNIHTRMDGIVVVDGDQLADNHTRLDHAYANCNSFEVYKHVLGGESTGVFNGKIFVHQDAQKTDAKQTNNTILLSAKATMNSKPQLEIFADDVKCTHGATVGYLDRDPVFYMQARGIPKAQAEALMVYAFAAEVLEKITVPGLVESLEAMLFAKLNVQ